MDRRCCRQSRRGGHRRSREEGALSVSSCGGYQGRTEGPAAIRRSPVVLDQHGQWVAPENLAQLPAAEASLLNAVVSAPAPALASRTKLLRRLRIRRKLSADDLTRFGPTIGGDGAIASAFEQLLNKNQRLLTPRTVASLRSIPFLRNKKGGLLDPGRLHLPTSANVACLDTDDAIVAGDNIALYRRLGCRGHPSFETLRGVLERLRRRGAPPRTPDILYPAVAGAFAAEKVAAKVCIDEPILWVEGATVPPKKRWLVLEFLVFFALSCRRLTARKWSLARMRTSAPAPV